VSGESLAKMTESDGWKVSNFPENQEFGQNDLKTKGILRQPFPDLRSALLQKDGRTSILDGYSEAL
jgi:hypothetical protein